MLFPSQIFKITENPTIVSGDSQMIGHQYSRLCSLIHNSLHPFKEKSTVSMTKEQQKSLLITLSQVLNQIKLWVGEFDSDSENDDHGNPLIEISCNTKCTTHASICHSSPSECISKITNDLVFLLALQNPYARHLTSNVLVAISEFVISSVHENYWVEFVQSLCYHFELIINQVVSPSSNPPNSKHLNHDSSTLNLHLQSVSSDSRMFLACAIVSVLRNILKHLKHEEDDENLKVYLNALGSCFRDIPWELFNVIFIDEVRSKQPVLWFEFCGHLLQLFCSVVSEIRLLETMVDSEDKNSVIHEIFKFFPNFLTWGLGKNGDDYGHMCISEYIQHKILVLMLRLSSLIKLDCEMNISWLHLINQHFQDLLLESFTQPKANQDNCLKDSPFVMFLDDEQKEPSHRHLQRRVVFLYLKCGFHLIKLKERSVKQCVCGDVNSCSKKGFIAIHEWLKKHLPNDIMMNTEFYFDNCKRFANSFVQLYMHEDDMLFEVLLLVTDMPNKITQDGTFEVVEKDILVLLFDIFNPINLFHIFLSKIHYDHQVILDYLISKDTGATFAEYLLRCLRIICDNWNAFMKFSFHEEVGSQSSYKRRKVMKQETKNQTTSKQPFDNATNCLLLLKKSVESSHQKDLFPYNPKVLLNRLTKFQELCASY